MNNDNTLKRLRKACGMTQSQLAKVLGVGRTNVTMWETGKTMPPTKYLVAIAKALGCTVDELLREERTQGVRGCKTTRS